MEVVQKLIKDMPGASVKDILEQTRRILIQNSILEIQTGSFETPFHIIEHLYAQGKTPEDISEILSVVSPSYTHTVHDFCTFMDNKAETPPQRVSCFSLYRKRNT